MRKVLLTVGAVVVIAVAAILIFAATKPDSFRVERSAEINAPPDRIFPYINELKRWVAWSPYEKRDPAMKRTYSGTEAGKGSVYEWDGNDDVGKGRMEIVEASAPDRILIKLDFLKPFEGHNMAEFTLQPNDGRTIVTWAMYGPSPYVSKLIDTVIGMDDMIGKDFAAGLANLKMAAEK